MELLPYIGLPIYNGTVSKVDALASTLNLEEAMLDACYMLKSKSNYYFQLGFYLHGGLQTSKNIIIEAHNELLTFTKNIEWWMLDDLVEHLDLYCKEVDYTPAWGHQLYYDLVAKGKTPRRLDGPNKGAMLSRTESRMVVYNEHKNLIYGPTIGYLQILEKKQRE